MLANLLAYIGFAGPLVRRIILEGVRAGTGWHVDNFGRIVCSNGRCILGALLLKKLGPDAPKFPFWGYAGEALKIPYGVAFLAMQANDNRHAKYRSFLLNAIAAHQQ